MLYAIIILSILVVILLLCIGVLLYGMKNNKKTLDGILGNDDVTEEEIISMVREGHEQGTILASEAELIHNVFEFDDKEVKDIMTHRKNIVSLDGNMSFIDAIEFIIDPFQFIGLYFPVINHVVILWVRFPESRDQRIITNEFHMDIDIGL